VGISGARRAETTSTNDLRCDRCIEVGRGATTFGASYVPRGRGRDPGLLSVVPS
jgi:hypothetical protein